MRPPAPADADAETTGPERPTLAPPQPSIGQPSIGQSSIDQPRIDQPIAAAHHFLTRLHPSSTILVAVSGGSDSIGLLLALHHALETSGAPHRLVACTIDHALRPGSAAEAAAVARRCQGLGIPHHVARWSHSGVTSGLQAEARLARYRLLCAAAETFGADLVVTGHSADDQAETIAMRAARSRQGGVDRDRFPIGLPPIGLAGMADAVLFGRRLWICRPFLGIRRQAVREMLTSRGEGWIDDPSNDDPRFERVRIRKAGPQPSAARAETAPPDAAAGRLRSAAVLSDRLTRNVRIHEAVAAEIALADLDLADVGWQRLLALLAATLAGKPHPIGQETAARLVSSLGDPAATAATAGSCVFERRGGRLFVYRERRNLPPPLIVAPGQSLVWDGRFTVENTGAVPLTVKAGGDPALTARLTSRDIPAGIAGRVGRASPQMLSPDGTPAGNEAFCLSPVIAPYDTFLPRFDLMIAQSMAAKFGRAPYPACPVDDIAMK
ncbi:tRNA(Ile)-lysidine synthase [Rhizobium sp. PP-F2F-G48]|uniref:tRNA lysidine(34) synthetase TilS n=1 Tax=Rhizobium sp. PP-F2F-G48 TaxID=2135651 RepID=UPI001046C4E0|nr:tRNA lysidine(34) synthetase TilS [Rhizobium sp. PP-F2F-G48]TCM53582.1 tRNA(Ile)-lysidine synthase [Rhizobium sp. PP-F2F-G48]